MKLLYEIIYIEDKSGTAKKTFPTSFKTNT